MYTEQYENNVNMTTEQQKQKKTSYSIKRLLKQLFKQHKSQQQKQETQQQQELFENYENDKKANSLESLESLENSRNADLESLTDSCISMESSENDANERLAASCELEDYEFADITSVPVHFLRTAHGTFFWTANSDMPADNDLIEPLYCSTGNQLATTQQMQDRWAQA